MLLSEVLQIAKNIKKHKELNESFKTNFFYDRIIKPFQNSTLMVKPNPIDDNLPMFNTFWKINRKLNSLHNLEGLDLVKTVKDKDALKTIANVKYIPFTTITEAFVKPLIYSIKNNSDQRIDLSQLKNSDFMLISKDEAKKKPYKNCLQFWFDCYNVLKAVCLDNKILFYVNENELSEDSWIEVNNDVDYSTIDFQKLKDNTYYYIREIVYKLFNHIKSYELIYNKNKIKNYLGAANIKNLILNGKIGSIYVIKPESMERTDITEKVKSREEYKQFLNDQIDLTKENIQYYKSLLYGKYKNRDYAVKSLSNIIGTRNRNAYKNKVKINKSFNFDINIQTKINKLLDICFDSLLTIQKREIEYLNNKDSKYKINIYLYLNSEQIPSSIKKIYKQDFKEDYYKDNYVSFYHIGDIFKYINISVQSIIDECKNIINVLLEYRKEKDNLDDNSRVSFIERLTNMYSALKKYVEVNNIYPSKLQSKCNEYNIQFNDVFIDIQNFYI